LFSWSDGIILYEIVVTHVYSPALRPSTMSNKPATPAKPLSLRKMSLPEAMPNRKISLADAMTTLEANLTAKIEATSNAQMATLRAENSKIIEENQKQQAVNSKIIAENQNLREVNNKLMARIDELMKKRESHDSPVVPVSPATPPPPPPPPSDDTFYDPYEATSDQRMVLILSDSIFRHVGVECSVEKRSPPDLLSRWRRSSGPKAIIKDFLVNDAVPVRKVVVPGARCDRIILEASLIAQQGHHHFREVIVHVGANYVSSHRALAAKEEIQQCLLSIQHLFPDAGVTYSVILPQYVDDKSDNATNLTINKLNDLIEDFCVDNGLNAFGVDAFSGYSRRLLTRGGIHLNRGGILAFNHTSATP